MTPGGRVKAAIELLDAIAAAARDQGPAADTLIARYFAERRYAGSKDRRAVRELVYAAIRLLGERPDNGRQAIVALARHDPAVAAMIDGSPHAPPPIDPAEPGAAAGVAPAWLVKRLERSGMAADTLPALLERAPLDIRVNRSIADPAAIAAEIEGAARLPHAPDGLRLPSGTAVEQLAAWRRGAIEVQDEGSQIVTMAAAAAPGMRVVDLCAGAGGKTLALAATMDNQGDILACDTDRARLSRLAPRAARAGVTIIETRLLNPGREAEALAEDAQRADIVLIDAPCSGTGTWRRNPEARWRLTPDRLARLTTLQAHLLDVACALVKPGGALVYVVCSLLDEEGAGQIAAFLARHPGWTPEPLHLPAGAARAAGWRLTPAHDGTDGFFVARLMRPC
ncbi:RsmB/NOP family class I SAM-dependent RNA methyltransferase [Hephaestia sp. GCM10023244]|uniref:RsmB/NOP family class I SAM-dependent RNA methyltransferase n=1 Tax=unclassified Hephaestia TaxID=2631281 RepID=UPI002077628C|nr:RsmB/NOP family class I SAM-dependent RNA methyltransferase [Hephaestia sp. MAHUQ-44]MCM8731374.1 RsmB/NOP family class I SAM-dependent RNA methyltransferase [Hephaestia sp. MAHUQ-44]